MHSPWSNYLIEPGREVVVAAGATLSGFQEQQQIATTPQQQRWAADLGSPLLQHEGLIELVQVWGSDLELASPGVFDSCIMESSWTSGGRELAAAPAAVSPVVPPPGQEPLPSPTSSAVSVRNLNHQSLSSRLGPSQQNQAVGLSEEAAAAVASADHSLDGSSSSSSLFNRGSMSGNSTSRTSHSSSDALQRSNDESVGSPSAGSSGLRHLKTTAVFDEHTNSVMYGGHNDWDEMEVENNELGDVSNKNRSLRGPTERMMDITLEELSRYFSMPITQASKELNVGLTVLKKRCREFGIPRWPHRKLKSLESLIHKSQELAKDSEGKPPNPVIHAVQELEKQKKKMEQSPALDLDDRTKRFRQAIFKASYKQRRRATVSSSTRESSETNGAKNSQYHHHGHHHHDHRQQQPQEQQP